MAASSVAQTVLAAEETIYKPSRRLAWQAKQIFIKTGSASATGETNGSETPCRAPCLLKICFALDVKIDNDSVGFDVHQAARDFDTLAAIVARPPYY